MDRETITKTAYMLLLQQQRRELPVEPALFCIPGFSLFSVTEYAQKTGLAPQQLTDGGALADGYGTRGLCEKYVAVYNEHALPGRRRFTIAHEIGHFILAHEKNGQREEWEAEYFASQLLMPEALLRRLFERGAPRNEAYLMRQFGVSRAAANRKLAELKLVRRHIFTPLDSKVQALFYAVWRTLRPL